MEALAAFYLGEERTLETVVLDDAAPEPTALARFADRVRSGAFELVVWVGGGAAAKTLAPAVPSLRRTTFVYVGGSLDDLGLAGEENVSAIRFTTDATQLTGYLAGLMTPAGADPSERVDVVGVVAGPASQALRRTIAAFEKGLHRAQPRARVLVGHVPDDRGERPCETLANRQIDAGAELIVSMAGSCGVGAIAVAGYRNVWAIADDYGDSVPPRLRDRLLAHTYSEVGPQAADAIQQYLAGTLPRGTTQVRGLDDDYAVGVWFNDAVPESVGSRVVELCSELRERSGNEPSRAA